MDGNGPPRVAVSMALAIDWGRRVLRGVIDYSRRHGPWSLSIMALGEGDPVRLPAGWSGDGIIASVNSQPIARDIAATGLPTVNVSTVKLKGVDLPRVTTDLGASAGLAAEHFLDRGFRNFAYCGPSLRYVEEHYGGFARVLAKAGCQCMFHKPGAKANSHWQVRQEEMADWLRELPKPVAILTWKTQFGREIINACRSVGLLVPEQVAVLGGDEDELLCEACNPPLSGIALTSKRIGYEAATLLDQLMRGRRQPKTPILIEPSGVVVRRSTDTLAIEDADLARAVRFIHDNATEAIQVTDVLDAVPISRSRLERRFQEVLGRTPAAEIRRVHLNRARQLLAETDMSVPDVAAASGFGSPEYLAHVFKRETGLTPHKYRSRVRGR